MVDEDVMSEPKHTPALPHLTTFDVLLELLRCHDVEYRVIEHEPEGRTAAASCVRGHPLEQAAKSMVVSVETDDEAKRYLLVVVPGMCRVDMAAAARFAGGRRARLAPPPVAEQLTGCVTGSIVPFSLGPRRIPVLVDPWLAEQPEIYFNAARLDRSVALRTLDYLSVAAPQLHPVATLTN
jgi:Ala-tRNA(Pro) deacylase